MFNFVICCLIVGICVNLALFIVMSVSFKILRKSSSSKSKNTVKTMSTADLQNFRLNNDNLEVVAVLAFQELNLTLAAEVKKKLKKK